MLENTEGAIKNRQSRETGNIGYIRRRQEIQNTQHNMCWTPLCANQHKQLEIKTNRTLYLCGNRNGLC
jgi:hypothetical protein